MTTPRDTLPPRLLARLDLLHWPETEAHAAAEVGAEIESMTGPRGAFKAYSYPEPSRDWPLGAFIVDAILDTVGPAAASILRRRVVLVAPPKDPPELVAVKRLAPPVSDAAKTDLLFSVCARHARRMLSPPEPGASLTADEARLYLVRAFDWACAILDEKGRPRRTVVNEPSWLVSRWGEAHTPAARALIEFGRSLPRAQLSLGDTPLPSGD